MSSWGYSNACNSSHGEMVCAHCRKPIESGQYRHRQKSKGGDWAYVVQHRACSAEDYCWTVFDKQGEAIERQRAELSDACKAFRAQWGVEELDEYIIGEQP